MPIGLMGLGGALAYIYRSEKGLTRAVWPDIIAIGLILDLLFTMIATAISLIPLGTSLSASLIVTLPTITSGPIPLWPIIVTLILGFVEFIIGALLVPVIKWLSEVL